MSNGELEDDEATQVLEHPGDALAAAILASKRRRAPAPRSVSDERTEALARPAPPERATRPYPWGALRRVRRAEQAATSRLARLLPGPGALETAARELEALTGAPHMITLTGVRVHASPLHPSDLGGSFVTRLSMPPDPEAGLVSVDARLVASTLGAMLGEDDATWRRHGAMGARDFGLATYAALRVMDAVSKAHGAPPLVVSSSPLSAEDLADPIEGGREVHEAVFEIARGEERGLARFFLPGHLVAAMEVFASRARSEVPAWLREVEVRAPVALGVGELSAAELAGLGAGDVLTLRSHGVRYGGIAPRGASRLMLSATRHVALGLEVRGEEWIARVGGPARADEEAEPEGEEQEMSEQSNEGNEAIALDDAGALLDEATVRVQAVVGDVGLSVARLSGLKVGELLELGVAVGAPVELRLVGGQRVGAGELVDVEGTLGVRVRSVTG